MNEGNDRYSEFGQQLMFNVCKEQTERFALARLIYLSLNGSLNGSPQLGYKT